jgi:hypothetical protein
MMSKNIRTPYEQQELQRKNPELYTTMSQMVGIDGALLTFEEVTRNIKKQLDRLEQLHDGNSYWWLFASKEQQAMYNFLLDQMQSCKDSFVRNYVHMQRNNLQ